MTLLLMRFTRLEADETLLIQSGKPVGVFKTRQRAAGINRQLQHGSPLGDMGTL